MLLLVVSTIIMFSRGGFVTQRTNCRCGLRAKEMRFEVKWSHASYKFRISLCNHLTDHLTVKWFKCTLFLFLFLFFFNFFVFFSVFERMDFYGFETKSCVEMRDNEFLIMSIKTIATDFINVVPIFFSHLILLSFLVFS